MARAELFGLLPEQEGRLRFHPTATAHLRWRFGGPAQVDAAIGALQVVANRHEALRMEVVRQGDRWCQAIRPPAPSVVPVDTVEGDDGAAAGGLPVDVEQGSPLRATLVVDGGDCSLVLSMNEVMIDCWSLPLLRGELRTAFAALAAGTEPDLCPLAVPYPTYVCQVLALGQVVGEKDVGYWSDVLRGSCPAALPLPESSTSGTARDDEPANAVFDHGAMAALHDAARRLRITAPLLVMVATILACSIERDTSDVTISHVFAGREDVAVRPMIAQAGTRAVYLRVRLDGQATLQDVGRQVASAWAGGITHSRPPYSSHALRHALVEQGELDGWEMGGDLREAGLVANLAAMPAPQGTANGCVDDMETWETGWSSLGRRFVLDGLTANHGGLTLAGRSDPALVSAPAVSVLLAQVATVLSLLRYATPDDTVGSFCARLP